MPFMFCLGIIAGIWMIAHLAFGESLVPCPGDTFSTLAGMVCTKDFWVHLNITLFRGVLALGAAVAAALVLGIGAGRYGKLMDLVSPLAAFVQAVPPILWITLVMVWAGTGNAVPVLVVFASLLPPLFMTVAMATASLNPQFFQLRQIYHIPGPVIIKDLILPGIFPHFVGGFSFALGSCLKVAAVAEFLGAEQGIGARIYWAYRMMEMERLFAWALVLVGLGMGLDHFLVRPLRRISQSYGAHNADT